LRIQIPATTTHPTGIAARATARFDSSATHEAGVVSKSFQVWRYSFHTSTKACASRLAHDVFAARRLVDAYDGVAGRDTDRRRSNTVAVAKYSQWPL